MATLNINGKDLAFDADPATSPRNQRRHAEIATTRAIESNAQANLP